MHDIYTRKKRVATREKKIETNCLKNTRYPVRGVRLGVVAAAASAAASVTAYTSVTTSCKLVGSRVPSVPAVAAVKTALVLVASCEGRKSGCHCLVLNR
jgi:hypothetical protein